MTLSHYRKNEERLHSLGTNEEIIDIILRLVSICNFALPDDQDNHLQWAIFPGDEGAEFESVLQVQDRRIDLACFADRIVVYLIDGRSVQMFALTPLSIKAAAIFALWVCDAYNLLDRASCATLQNARCATYLQNMRSMDADVVEDGFGGAWVKCDRADCDLHVVRPGKAQCSCEDV